MNVLYYDSKLYFKRILQDFKINNIKATDITNISVFNDMWLIIYIRDKVYFTDINNSNLLELEWVDKSTFKEIEFKWLDYITYEDKNYIFKIKFWELW